MKGARLAGSVRVAGGILSSRVLGLVREAAVAFAFGAGGHGDVFGAVMRGPNLLQNLLGEQTLSASFIPVYSRMLEAGRREDAGRLAGAMLGLLLAAAAAVSLIGILFAAPIVTVLAPGFLADAGSVGEGALATDRFALAVKAVRILFPMSGFLVLSAWALGVLNSHRRFFLPYFAPVLWNSAIIAALVGGALWLAGAQPPGGGRLDRLLLIACWGALVGGLLQFLVQLPLVLRLSRGLRVTLSTRVDGVRDTLRALGPMLGARGALQISAYLDQVLASLLAVGAIIGLRYGSILYLLPFALFGASVAAAELPELARRRGAENVEEVVARTRSRLRQIAFLVVPTAAGYLAFGFLIVGAVYRRGSFGLEANWLVYLVLGAYSLGLLANSWSRLLQNLYYAHGNTRIPATTAVFRVVASTALGVWLMLRLDAHPVAAVSSLAPAEGALRLGAVGLALAGGFAAWLELALLRARGRGVVPRFGLPWGAVARMLGLVAIALAPAFVVWYLTVALPAWLAAPLVVGSYAAIYLGLARWRRWPELDAWLGRLPGGAGGSEGK